MGWWQKAKSADANYSLVSWCWEAAKWAVPGSVAGLVAWAASYRDWIWNDYGMLGVMSLGLIAALIASAAVALSGVGFRAFRKSENKSHAPPLHSDSVPQSNLIEETKPPRKYYSTAEREKFASALFELRDVCKRDGERIFKNIGTFLVDWQSRRSEAAQKQPFQGPYILDFINLIRGQTDNFQLSIYSPDGVLGKNPTFPELSECVGTGAGTIQDIKIALSHFECAVRVTEKLEDKNAVGMMTWTVMAPIRDNLAAAQSKFGGWLRDTENHVRTKEEDLKQ